MLVINESDFSTATLQQEGNAFLDTLASTVVGSEIQVDIVSMPAITTTGLTDAELRASPVPVSVTGGGDASAANQVTQTGLLTTIDADTSNLDVLLSTRLKPADTLAGVTTVGTITNVVHVDDNASSLTVDDGGSSITVDGTVSVTGVSTAANQATEIASLSSIDAKLPSGLTVTGSRLQVELPVGGGGLTDAELRATPVPISGTITANLAAGTNNIGDVDIASIGAGTNYIGKVRLTDGTTDGEIVPLTGYNAQAVAIVNSSGTQVTDFATESTLGAIESSVTSINDNFVTPTVRTEDDATDANPIGLQIVARRRDSLGVETTTDGDITALNVTGKGELYVKHVDALPITDNSSSLTIDDGGGSITIDGTVTANIAAGTNNIGDVDVLTLPSIPAGTNNIGDVDIASITAGDNLIGRIKLSDGTDVADVLDLANSNPLTVAIVDASGDQITSFGGGTQYTEGDVDASIAGTAILMEGVGNTLVPAQGTTADGLLVNLGSNNDVTVTGSVTVSATDLDVRNLVFATDKVDASGTTLGANSGVDIGDVTINNASGGSAVNVQDGGNSLTVDAPVGTPVFVRLSDGASAITALPITDNSGSLTVDNGGTFATQENGAALTSLQLLDDTVYTDDTSTHSTGSSKGTLLMAAATPTDASVDSNDIGAVAMTTDRRLQVAPLGYFVTCSTDVTRPADTTAYSTNDALSNSTSAPTSGGFTFTGAARKSGGSGIITDAIITTSNDPVTTLAGEIWIFNTSVTNINDNAAFAVSDSEIKTCIGKIPFTLEDAGNNGFYHAQNLSIGFTCSGSADLRFLVRTKNAYTPASAEVLTFVIKVLQVD